MVAQKKKESVKAKVKSLDIKNYAILKVAYDLPDEHVNPILIIRKMAEHLELYLKIVQQILQPEEFSALYECAAFDDVEKKKLLELYKTCIVIHRELLKCEIIADDAVTSKCIEKVHSQIQSVKPDMLKIVQKMQDSWGHITKKDVVKYFG